MVRAADGSRKAGMARRRGRTVALLVAACALCWLVWGAAHAPQDPAAAHAPQDPAAALRNAGGVLVKRPGIKYILLWNEYFNYPNLGYGEGTGSELFHRHNCPVKDCFMTDDKTLMAPEEYDAVVMHMYYFSMSSVWLLNMGKLPSARRPEQRYIFFLLESPANCGSEYKNMENVFNWTMTYRTDSDIVSPYGIVVPLEGVKVPSRGWLQHPSPPVSPSVAAAQVTKSNQKGVDRLSREGPDGQTLVAWLVSHCSTQSLREEYVAKLSMHVQVHVYGDCGTHWPKGDYQGFLRMLEHTYKFYLSFENSLCRDYVTEKLFQIFDIDVVPVVYGAANYSAVAPPHSYIDARQFASPRELAEYLQFLARHPEEYEKFFWWKKYYKVINNPQSTLCKLCAKLHERLPYKSYADMQDWWNGDGTCVEPEISNIA